MNVYNSFIPNSQNWKKTRYLAMSELTKCATFTPWSTTLQ